MRPLRWFRGAPSAVKDIIAKIKKCKKIAPKENDLEYNIIYITIYQVCMNLKALQQKNKGIG